MPQQIHRHNCRFACAARQIQNARRCRQIFPLYANKKFQVSLMTPFRLFARNLFTGCKNFLTNHKEVTFTNQGKPALRLPAGVNAGRITFSIPCALPCK